LVSGAALVIVLAGLKAATPILIPFLLSAFITIVASPLVQMLRRLKLPMVVAVLFVLLLVVTLMLFVAGVVGSSVSDFNRSIPLYREQLLASLGWLTIFAERFDIHISVEVIRSYFDPGVVFRVAANTLTGISGMATNMLVILLVTIFMMLEAESFPKKLSGILNPSGNGLSQVDRVIQSVNRYIAVKTFVSFVTGMTVFLSMLWFKLDYAILWGLLAFLMNYIPNVGSLLAAIPAVLLALLQLGASQGLGVAMVYLLINLVAGNIVEPRLMGKGLGLSSLVVVLSLIFWGWLFGSVGMLLSVPLTVLIKIALESSRSGHWITRLLSHPDELEQEPNDTTTDTDPATFSADATGN
jgi:predicted PurR-regulated permease PerM